MDCGNDRHSVYTRPRPNRCRRVVFSVSPELNTASQQPAVLIRTHAITTLKQHSLRWTVLACLKRNNHLIKRQGASNRLACANWIHPERSSIGFRLIESFRAI